jgi:hypothetical protein
MFLTDEDKRAMALDDAIKYLKLSREAIKVLDYGYEVDDAYVEILDILEYDT